MKSGHLLFFQTKVFANSPNLEGSKKQNFNYNNSLSFSILKDSIFKARIPAKKHISTGYMTLSWQTITGSLLDCHYEIHMKEMYQHLWWDTDAFGVTIYGDGDTINKRPMINIMAASACDPQYLIHVVSYLDHMADEGIKDACYLVSQYIHAIVKLDEKWTIYNMPTFAGASKVQNGMT